MNKNNRYNEPSFIGINFCPECNNMLYPKEDKATLCLLERISTAYWKKDMFFFQNQDFDRFTIIYSHRYKN